MTAADTEPDMTTVDPLALLVHKIAPQQFDIAQGFTYISIRDQLNRATMVVNALVAARQLQPKSHQPSPVAYDWTTTAALSVDLVIFGAGAGGLAAARAAKAHHLSFALVDCGSNIPGGVLASDAQRYVSVSMYEWPNTSSTQHNYPLAHPLVISSSPGALTLKYAQPMLIKEFAQEFKNALNADLLQWKECGDAIKYSRGSVSVVPQFSITEGFATQDTKARLALTLDRPPELAVRNCSDSIQVDLNVGGTAGAGSTAPVQIKLNALAVLYATGFEKESLFLDREKKFKHAQNSPFWSSDSFDEPMAGCKSAPHVLIQGSGDGALQDLFRMCVERDVNRNDPLRAWDELEQRARTLAIEASTNDTEKVAAGH